MFKFNKKKKEKKQGHLDKVLMGVIVGGAIGSVLGVGLAPKKGSEIRKDVGKQTGKIFNGAKKLLNKTKFVIKKLKKNPKSKKIVNEIKNVDKLFPEEK